MSNEGNTIIESIGVYLPPRVVPTRETLGRCRNLVPFPIEELTGIRSVHMAGDEEFAIDLAKRAVADCLRHSRVQPDDIELLICCNISHCDGPGFRYTFEPSTAARVKAHFGFARAWAFDVSNACPGMFTGIKVADSYLRTDAVRWAMVVSGEYITHITRTAQLELESLRDPRLACLTLGDAGAAVILERAPDKTVGFHSIGIYTAGAYSDLCVGKVTDREHGGAIMYTQPVRLAPAAIRNAIAHSVHAVRRQGWTPESVQHLIPHQTSRKTLTDMSKGLDRVLERKGWAEGITLDNLEKRGNTATTSHFVAVKDHIESGRIRSGDAVVFSIAGSGLTVGTALFTFDDLPDRLRENGHKSRRREPRPRPEAVDPRPGASFPVRVHEVGVLESNGGRAETVALASRAAERCLAHSGIDRSDLGLLLFTGVHRTDFVCEPAIAALVAGALDLNASDPAPGGRTTLAFDVSNGSLGFLHGCQVALQMLRSGDCEWALVVAAEIDNNLPEGPEPPRGIAETASAVLLSRAPSDGFGEFVFRAHPAYVGDLESYITQAKGRSFLRVEDTGLLDEHALEQLPGAVAELLEKEGLALADVRWVLPPQRSSSFIARLTQRLGVPADRVVDVVGRGKDLFTSSLPFALHHLLEGRARPGDAGLLLEAGSGGQVGCAVYRF